MTRKAVVFLDGEAIECPESRVRQTPNGVFIIKPQRNGELVRENSDFYPWHKVNSIHYYYKDNDGWRNT